MGSQSSMGTQGHTRDTRSRFFSRAASARRKTARRPCTRPEPPRAVREEPNVPRASSSSFRARNFRLVPRTAGNCGYRTASTRARPSGSARTEGRPTAAVDAWRRAARSAFSWRHGRPVRQPFPRVRETWSTQGHRRGTLPGAERLSRRRLQAELRPPPVLERPHPQQKGPCPRLRRSVAMLRTKTCHPARTKRGRTSRRRAPRSHRRTKPPTAGI